MMCFRYYLYHLAFQHWQTFISLQKEKKSKGHLAVQFGKLLRQAKITCLNLHFCFSLLDTKHSFCDIMDRGFFSQADRQLMHLAWNRWDILRDLRMKKRMLESALELKKLKSIQ